MHDSLPFFLYYVTSNRGGAGMKLRPAYTLLELLVVITLFGLLLGWTMVDYRKAGAKQAERLQGEALQALVQQMHAEVRAGHVREDAFLCQGLYFKPGLPVMQATGVYVAGDDVCEQKESALYGNGKALPLKDVSVGGTSVQEAWAFFMPPNGEFRVFGASGGFLPGEVLFHLEPEQEGSVMEFSLPLQGFPLTMEHDA